MIDHHVHRVTEFLKMPDRSIQQRLCLSAAEAWKNDQSGVNLFGGNQSAEVPGIFCHDDEVVCDAAREHLMVGLSSTAKVQGIDSEMIARRIQIPRKLR